MTLLVYDGATLATDGIMTAGESHYTETDFNKIWKAKDFVFSICGQATDYWKVKDQLDAGADVTELKMTDKSTCMLFDAKNKQNFYLIWADGLCEHSLSKVYAAGSGDQYALGILDLGCDAKFTLNMAKKRIPFIGGKTFTLNIRKHFQW